MNLIVEKTVDGCTVSMVSSQTIWQGNKLHDGDKVEWLYTCVRGDL